jgi:hypothetical protein
MMTVRVRNPELDGHEFAIDDDAEWKVERIADVRAIFLP